MCMIFVYFLKLILTPNEYSMTCIFRVEENDLPRVTIQ